MYWLGIDLGGTNIATGVVDENLISEAVQRHVDLRPAAIIDKVQLRRPIYSATAAYGHMGREDLDVRWEKTDRTEALLAAAE